MEVARLTAVIDANTSGFTRAMKQVDSNLNSTNRAMGRYYDSNGRLREANGRFAASASGMNSALDGTNRRFGVLSRTSSGIGRAMAFGGAAVASFGVAAGVAAGVGVYKSIQAASDLNETVSKTNVVFGKASKDVISWSKTSATSFGMSQRATLDAASSYAIFAKSAGMGDKEAANFSKTLVSTSADLASFYNTSTDEAATAIQAALRGETEPIRKYGVMLDDATLRQRAFAMGITASTKDALTPQQKVLAAQAEIMKQTSVAQGDFARTSGGMANQQRILNATMEDAKAKIGTAFLPFVNMILPKLVAAIPPVVEAITGFTTKISAIGQAFLGNTAQMTAFKATATGIFSQVGAAVSSFATPIKNAFLSLARDPQVAMPILRSFGTIVTTIGNIARTVAPALGQYLGAAITAIGRIAGAVMPVVALAFEKLGPPLARLIVAAARIGAVFIRIFGAVIPPVVRALMPVFSAVFSAIGAILDTVASLLSGDFVGAFTNAKAAIKAVWITIPSMLLGVIVDAIGALVSAAVDLGGRVVEGIASGIVSGAGRIASAIGGALKDAILSVDIPGMSPPEHAAMEGLGKPMANGVIMGFLNGTASLPEKMADSVKRALERGKAAIDAQKEVVSKAFGGVIDVALRAFDMKTKQIVEKIKKPFADAMRAVETEIAGRMSTITKEFDLRVQARRDQGAELTPAEAELKAMRDAYDAQQRELDKADALSALQAAQAGGDAKAILDAQKRYDDLLYQEKVSALEKVAEAERAAKDKATEADIATIEEDRNRRLAALDQERNDRLAAIQAQQDDAVAAKEFERELERQRYEERLNRMLAAMTKFNGNWRGKTKELTDFLASKGLRDTFDASGEKLGNAFAAAMEGTKGRVTKAVRALANLVKDYLKLSSPSKLGPLSTLDKWWTPMADTLLSGVDGSMIGQVAASIAAPDDGFGASRANAGGATTVINVTVQGNVTSERELVDTIRSELLRTGQRNGSIFGGYA